MGKNWAERFPNPGDAPPRPADQMPDESEAIQQWWQDCYAWNSYVQAGRCHHIARSMDELMAKGALEPAEIISLNIGASFLDGTIAERFLLGPVRGSTSWRMRPL